MFRSRAFAFTYGTMQKPLGCAHKLFGLLAGQGNILTSQCTTSDGAAERVSQRRGCGTILQRSGHQHHGVNCAAVNYAQRKCHSSRANVHVCIYRGVNSKWARLVSLALSLPQGHNRSRSLSILNANANAPAAADCRSSNPNSSRRAASRPKICANCSKSLGPKCARAETKFHAADDK